MLGDASAVLDGGHGLVRRVVQACPWPVVIVPMLPDPVGRIVVGLGREATDSFPLRFAESAGARLDCTLAVVHVAEHGLAGTPSTASAMHLGRASETELLLQIVADSRARTGREDTFGIVGHGDAAHALATECSTASLVVVGRHMTRRIGVAEPVWRELLDLTWAPIAVVPDPAADPSNHNRHLVDAVDDR